MRKIILNEKDMPDFYYNVQVDLPEPLLPPLHPVTREPIKADDLKPIFPQSLIKQETSDEREIEIPKKVRDKYLSYRPTPLIRALALEEYLNTPARIYYKHEGISPAGSHKLNTAIPQAYFNSIEGIRSLTTETGAGQWGSALSMACSFFNLKCKVFMVKASFEQKPYRRILMELFDAQVLPSPSSTTESGRKTLETDPNSPGSLGIAISEAVEEAVKNPDTNYALGSVLNHVLLHQSIIGLEVKKQLKLADESPEILIGCVGGGSNFGGLIAPFVKKKIKNNQIRLIAVEPSVAASLTKGIFEYDYGDTMGFTPLLAMYTLGHNFVPPPIHAGGLRYHGMAPIISNLYKNKIIEACSYDQKSIFEAARIFAKTEGITPAPESAHAIKKAIDEALIAKEEKKERTIVFLLSGHGYLDLSAYEKNREIN
ncbi:tryptophan synthase beta chain [Thermodesulfobium acidiphilum]|uniref:Tryptophan synthase beta chain n=1 Tax=Thermodesulfobium acidiphilum TaxID=1794699 RepID=A0A2R4VZ23_THEAF|nr:TrpB-like pyridoxal phosphate-dependent enzyme [Thermodesulfobium acidiphilum]AWB09801.1 tryptophan synthase beta chain [Thermodesulfobium acidiphilum]